MTQTRKYLLEFFGACYLDRSRSEIEDSVASLNEQQTDFLFQKILKRVLNDNTRHAGTIFSRNGWFMDMEFPPIPLLKSQTFMSAAERTKRTNSWLATIAIDATP